jgi:hypothetical protein
MEGMGVIQSDPDLQFSLITRKGLQWLEQRSPNIHPCRPERSMTIRP